MPLVGLLVHVSWVGKVMYSSRRHRVPGRYAMAETQGADLPSAPCYLACLGTYLDTLQ
jgi:hypothetical protein